MSVRLIIPLKVSDGRLASRLWPHEARNAHRRVNLMDGRNGHVAIAPNVGGVLAIIVPDHLPFVVWIDPTTGDRVP